ncbi:hypothetical protein GQR58_023813 [Nymphon striatum]|nr:hypothetical protein GQR58_023813 [Nymphon striatum]
MVRIKGSPILTFSAMNPVSVSPMNIFMVHPGIAAVAVRGVVPSWLQFLEEEIISSETFALLQLEAASLVKKKKEKPRKILIYERTSANSFGIPPVLFIKLIELRFFNSSGVGRDFVHRLVTGMCTAPNEPLKYQWVVEPNKMENKYPGLQRFHPCYSSRKGYGITELQTLSIWPFEIEKKTVYGLEEDEDLKGSLYATSPPVFVNSALQEEFLESPFGEFLEESLEELKFGTIGDLLSGTSESRSVAHFFPGTALTQKVNSDRFPKIDRTVSTCRFENNLSEETCLIVCQDCSHLHRFVKLYSDNISADKPKKFQEEPNSPGCATYIYQTPVYNKTDTTRVKYDEMKEFQKRKAVGGQGLVIIKRTDLWSMLSNAGNELDREETQSESFKSLDELDNKSMTFFAPTTLPESLTRCKKKANGYVKMDRSVYFPAAVIPRIVNQILFKEYMTTQWGMEDALVGSFGKTYASSSHTVPRKGCMQIVVKSNNLRRSFEDIKIRWSLPIWVVKVNRFEFQSIGIHNFVILEPVDFRSVRHLPPPCHNLDFYSSVKTKMFIISKTKHFDKLDLYNRNGYSGAVLDLDEKTLDPHGSSMKAQKLTADSGEVFNGVKCWYCGVGMDLDGRSVYDASENESYLGLLISYYNFEGASLIFCLSSKVTVWNVTFTLRLPKIDNTVTEENFRKYSWFVSKLMILSKNVLKYEFLNHIRVHIDMAQKYAAIIRQIASVRRPKTAKLNWGIKQGLLVYYWTEELWSLLQDLLSFDLECRIFYLDLAKLLCLQGPKAKCYTGEANMMDGIWMAFDMNRKMLTAEAGRKYKCQNVHTER